MPSTAARSLTSAWTASAVRPRAARGVVHGNHETRATELERHGPADPREASVTAAVLRFSFRISSPSRTLRPLSRTELDTTAEDNVWHTGYVLRV
jgi:hypothetical protein